MKQKINNIVQYMWNKIPKLSDYTPQSVKISQQKSNKSKATVQLELDFSGEIPPGIGKRVEKCEGFDSGDNKDFFKLNKYNDAWRWFALESTSLSGKIKLYRNRKCKKTILAI